MRSKSIWSKRKFKRIIIKKSWLRSEYKKLNIIERRIYKLIMNEYKKDLNERLNKVRLRFSIKKKK